MLHGSPAMAITAAFMVLEAVVLELLYQGPVAQELVPRRIDFVLVPRGICKLCSAGRREERSLAHLC
jgi:hypothetical protein